MQIERHPMESEKLAILSNQKFVNLLLETFNSAYATVTSIARTPRRSFPVTKETFPRIYTLYTDISHRLGIEDEIPLYIEEEYALKHETLGTDGKCIIVISSACVECLTDEELSAALGYELGHIMFRHIKYLNTFNALDDLACKVPKIAEVGIEAIKVLFIEWRQYAEYSADRAAAYAAGSKKAVIDFLLKKLGAVNSVVDYEFSDSEINKINILDVSKLDKIGKIVLSGTYEKAKVPLAILRMRELSKEYED